MHIYACDRVDWAMAFDVEPLNCINKRGKRCNEEIVVHMSMGEPVPTENQSLMHTQYGVYGDLLDSHMIHLMSVVHWF